MKKQLLLYCTLGAISIGFGWWLRARMSVPFTGFTGQYECGDFGLPDKNYNILRFNMISEDQFTVDALKGSETHEVGRLRPQSSSLARLELATSLVHAPTLPLNPLAEHFFEGRGKTVALVGGQDGKVLYRYVCHFTGK